MAQINEYEKPPPYSPGPPGYQQVESSPVTGGFQPYPGQIPSGKGMPQPPPGYQPYPGPSPYGDNYGSTGNFPPSTVPIHATQVILVGGCPACRVGVLENDFTCLGIFCAIAFFPLGILCCLAMQQRRCPNCGAIFG